MNEATRYDEEGAGEREELVAREGLAETFEDLRIWQAARRLFRETHESLRNGAAAKDLAFRHQMQRAALSVMNNIAEGFERRTPADFAHFLDLAKGSSGEVRSMTYAGEDVAYFSIRSALRLRTEYRDLSMSIAALARHLRKGGRVER